MKQRLRPAPEFDYYALAPLHQTLEQMFVIGTPRFSSAFKHFTRLHTLSIGKLIVLSNSSNSYLLPRSTLIHFACIGVAPPHLVMQRD